MCKKIDCAICGKEDLKHPDIHNPDPVLDYDHRVCTECNSLWVIPARLGRTISNSLRESFAINIKKKSENK
jgi:hypothetical protein